MRVPYTLVLTSPFLIHPHTVRDSNHFGVCQLNDCYSLPRSIQRTPLTTINGSAFVGLNSLRRL